MNKNKKDILYRLAKEYRKLYKGSNWLIIGAIAITILNIFSIYSIQLGRMRTEQMILAQKDGSLENAVIQQGNEEQHIQLSTLEYVKTVGMETKFATMSISKHTGFTCAYLDKNGYDLFRKPVYKNIIGQYPQDENEIMMSKRVLEIIGIHNPSLGMKIPIKINWKDWTQNTENGHEENMILSGYYEDLSEESGSIVPIYFSRAYLQMNSLQIYPADLLIQTKNELLEGIKIEQMIYRDITFNDEQSVVSGKDSAKRRAFIQTIGGMTGTLGWSAILIISSYLFIYNILNITFIREVRQYGQLELLGCTKKEIYKIVSFFYLPNVIGGTMAGFLIATLVIKFILPRLLDGYYLTGYGGAKNIVIYNGMLLIGICIIVMFQAVVAIQYSIKRLENIQLLEACFYNEGQKKMNFISKIPIYWSELSKMAWRNVTTSKRYWITILILIIGCLTALGMNIFMRGSDLINELNKNPDFMISPSNNAIFEWIFYSDREKELLPEKFVKEVLREEKNQITSYKIICGGIVGTDFDSPILQPRQLALEHQMTTVAILQIVDDEYLNNLEKYLIEQGISADIRSVRKGKGFFILHNHELSPQLQEKAMQFIGTPLHMEDIDAESENAGGKLICGGYLDYTEKGFPHIDIADEWYGNDDRYNTYMIVKENALKEIHANKRILQISYSVNKNIEPTEKKKIMYSVARANLRFNESTSWSEKNILFLESNSDRIAKEQQRITVNRLLMRIICMTLLLGSVASYLNTMISDIVARKNIFTLMQNVGMTRKQIKRMIMYEGLYYGVIVIFLSLTIGMLFLWLLSQFIKHKIPYFMFVYPWKSVSSIVILLLILCISIPNIVFKRKNKNN